MDWNSGMDYGIQQKSPFSTILYTVASFILFHSLHGGSIDASQFKAELTINRLGCKI